MAISKCYNNSETIVIFVPIMLQLHNIGDAVKQSKRRKNKDEGAPIRVNGITRQRLSRIIKGESKASLSEFEGIAMAYGCNIVVLSAVEYQIMQGISPFLSEIVAKGGVKG